MSLIDTMVTIFNDNYSNDKHNIIKCFSEKDKCFYLYNNDIWSKMDDVQFKMIFNVIYKGLITYFKEWEELCFENGCEKSMLNYLEVNQKIYTDGNILLEKFKTKLYNDLKISFRNH